MNRLIPCPPRLIDAAPGALAGPQTICLGSIMRENDPAVVRRGLLSVRPFLTHWVVVDTGSTAEVKATIRSVLSDLPGELIEREWPDDFSVARNWALVAAHDSGADVAMFHDADDYVVPRCARRTSTGIELIPLPAIDDSLTFMSLSHGFMYERYTFVRMHAPLFWFCPAHERLFRGAEMVPITPVSEDYVVAVTKDGAASQDPERQQRYYMGLLERHLASVPEDAGAWANLGRAYVGFSRFDDARACADRALALIPPESTPQNALALLLGALEAKAS